jgi:Flp pilus assembly protein CpaB
MWKVKRMNTARIVVLTIAVGAGGIAAYLASVTLELKPEQTETLARARQSGTLSLALRSIADLNVVDTRSDDQAPRRGDSVNVVRFGVSTPTTTQK